jgi:hypothetical protein
VQDLFPGLRKDANDHKDTLADPTEVALPRLFAEKGGSGKDLIADFQALWLSPHNDPKVLNTFHSFSQ